MKSIWRVLGFIHQIQPGCILLELVKIIFEAVQPYIPLYFSGLMVSAVIAGERTAAQKVAIEGVCITFIGTVILAILRTAGMKIRTVLDIKSRGEHAKKEMRMNYEELVSKKMRTDLQKMRTERETVHANFSYLVEDCGNILKSLISFGVAGTILVQLFSIDSKESSSLARMVDSPVTELGILCLIIFLLIMYYRVIVKIGDAYYANISQMYDLDRVLWYYDREYLDVYVSGKDVRIFEQQDIINASCKDSMDLSVRVAQNMSLAQGMGSGISKLFALGVSAVMIVFVVLKAAVGAADIGMLVTYIGTASTVSSVMQRLSVACTNLHKTKSYFDTYFAIPVSKENIISEMKITEAPVIEFRHVYFRYQNMKQDALRDVSFVLQAGECTALVGRNGSGKSTVIALLCGFLKPDSGEILLNGRNIGEYKFSEYQKMISAIFQDFHLPAFSVGENIAISEIFDEKKISDTLERAGVDRRKFSDLKQHLYREFDAAGVEPSGGEAQKIAIARALYKDVPILVMDEPTAALDPLTEIDIYRHMKDLTYGKTAVFVSHRLSSCRFCDKIIVLREGQVVQVGRHDELVEFGEYGELWALQAWYYDNKITTAL